MASAILMAWVRQRQPPKHICDTPIYPSGHVRASFNDLWRCDECSQLWRAGYACDYCDYYDSRGVGHSHLVGLKWRHATWLQQLFYRKR